MIGSVAATITRCCRNSVKEFRQGSGEISFIADAPPFYLLNPVRFSINTTLHDFVKGFTYAEVEHSARNIGFQLSPETLIYGESLRWAMINDLTHNVVIIGLQDSVVDAFKASFQEKHFNITDLVNKLEVSQCDKMDNREQAIATYS